MLQKIASAIRFFADQASWACCIDHTKYHPPREHALTSQPGKALLARGTRIDLIKPFIVPGQGCAPSGISKDMYGYPVN